MVTVYPLQSLFAHLSVMSQHLRTRKQGSLLSRMDLTARVNTSEGITATCQTESVYTDCPWTLQRTITAVRFAYTFPHCFPVTCCHKLVASSGQIGSSTGGLGAGDIWISNFALSLPWGFLLVTVTGTFWDCLSECIVLYINAGSVALFYSFAGTAHPGDGNLIDPW